MLRIRIFTCVIEKEFSLRYMYYLVSLASQYESEIILQTKKRTVNMQSILGLCSLALQPGEEVEIRTFGMDEEEAIQAIKQQLHHDKYIDAGR
ncbi:HPr family phosphocarrier protein [Bacillus sp. 165]|uniref:HPr family phosphocarrier protein n=1 Tax=Bacillus sp. 165 TaxID=1529117 RepID=UPI001ADB13BB|nr:HPr family phosphocarrier protein [Bacillus sp. 165]